MADNSAKPILVAGAVAFVALLGVAWAFTASTSRQAVVNANESAAGLMTQHGGAEVETEAHAEEEPAQAETETAEVKTEEPAEEPKAEEPAETQVAEAEQPAAEEEPKAEEPQLEEPKAEETETAEATPAPAPPPTEAASVEGDAAAGKKVFRKCKACHTFDKNKVGPNLKDVVGRKFGAIDGFKYSAALMEMADKSWTPEELDAFLKKPKDYMPGTKMAFAGLRKDDQRANVIAYLATNGE